MARTGVRLEDAVKFAENPEPRCPCVLLLDTSASMDGERIAALSKGVRTLKTELGADPITSQRVELAVVSFSTGATVIQDFVSAKEFHPPQLTASGQTFMGAGIERALDLVDARKKMYRETGVTYYRPRVFMITDGVPDGESAEVVDRAAKRLQVAEASSAVAFFAVAVGNADTQSLSRIVVRTPLELEGLCFDDLFVWLSASMQSVSQSRPGETVVLPRMNWIKRIAVFLKENEDEIKAGIHIGKALAGL